MIHDLDPDVRLSTRLAVGPSWHGSLDALLWFGAIAGFSALRGIDPQKGIVTERAAVEAAAVLSLMVAPSRPFARLLDLERTGVLDHVRLCGRPPLRTLLAFAAGSMWPFVALAAALFAVDLLRLEGTAGTIRFGLILFVIVLDLALLTFATGPGRVRDGWVITVGFGMLAFGGYLGVLALEALGYLSPTVFDWRLQLAALAGAGALPPSVWMAVRFMRRPARVRSWSRARLTYEVVFARYVPRDGPPELLRRLRSSVGAVGATTIGAQCVFAVIAMIVARRSRLMYGDMINALPYIGLPAVAIATAVAVRHEIQSRSIELVRLTPQRPAAIALGWFAGLALPFWTAALFAVVALRVVAADVAQFSWSLPALALLLPAVALLEGLELRLPGSYGALFLLVAGLIVEPYIQTLPRLTPIGGIPTSTTPWGLHLPLLVPIFVTVVALAAACGRVDRPDGPALAGGAAVAAIAAVALGARLVQPTIAYPRTVIGVLPLFGGLFAEERMPRSAPWLRLGIVAFAAFVSVDLVTAEGRIPMDAALVTGACAAVAVAIGLLAHELWGRRLVVSLGVQLLTLMVVLRFPYELVRSGTRGRFSFYYVSYVLKTRVPADPGIGDLAVLVAACAALLVLHRDAVGSFARRMNPA